MDLTEFMFRNNLVFDSALREFVCSYRPRDGIYFETISVARRYLVAPTPENKKNLSLTLSNKERLDNFQVIEIIKFVDDYSKKRKEMQAFYGGGG